MNLVFSVQTLKTTAVGSLRSMTPDEDGFYRKVPLSVIGVPSRNNINYNVASMERAMRNPKGSFFQGVKGGLEGEWGHPILAGLDKHAALSRLSQVDRNLVSHYIVNIVVEKSRDGDFSVVYGDVKASGSNGKHLTEAFADRNRDCSFSLRSLTSMPQARANSAIKDKSVVAMVTYDCVNTPGFELASKRGMTGGTESMLFEEEDYQVGSIEDFGSVSGLAETIGYESINCQEVLDLLESDKVAVSIEDTEVGVFNTLTGKFSNGLRESSAFHKMFRG